MAVISSSYNDALSKVKSQVAASRTSFHAGMAILPKARREAMYALYSFCRAVDDIADDSPTPEIAARGLQEWRVKITDVFNGKVSDAITTALLPAIHTFGLIEKNFQEIIDGMQMDSVAIVAPNLQTLDHYCDLVASAVGRASVRIFGDSSDNAMQVAHHLGRALQLTNILRDIAEDAARGRLYLPHDLLDKHGMTSRNPMEILRDTRLVAVCRDVAELAQEHYAKADIFMKKCVPAAMRPAKIMRLYYGTIFNRLVALDWQNPTQRVTLSKPHKIWLSLKGLFI